MKLDPAKRTERFFRILKRYSGPLEIGDGCSEHPGATASTVGYLKMTVEGDKPVSVELVT